MSLLRSILAFNATSVRSALACALAVGAGTAYYAAIDWDDVAMATSAEAVTMPPIVRATPDTVSGARHQLAELEHSEPTADDLVPAVHAPPVVTAPKREPLYTGSLSTPAAAATAAPSTMAHADIAPSKPETSMLTRAWAPAGMLQSRFREAEPTSGNEAAPAQDVKAAANAERYPFAGRTMTASAVDPHDDDALRAVMRSSVALAPNADTSAPQDDDQFAPSSAPVVAEPDPAPTAIEVEPDTSAHSEDDSDIAPVTQPAKKPVARAAKPMKKKPTKSQGSALEEGFYSIQREISSFFN